MEEIMGIEVKISKLETKIDFILEKLKDLEKGILLDIELLKKDKADKYIVEDLQNKMNNFIESRINKLEVKTTNYKLTLTLYSIAVGFMIALNLYHILGK